MRIVQDKDNGRRCNLTWKAQCPLAEAKSTFWTRRKEGSGSTGQVWLVGLAGAPAVLLRQGHLPDTPGKRSQGVHVKSYLAEKRVPTGHATEGSAKKCVPDTTS